MFFLQEFVAVYPIQELLYHALGQISLAVDIIPPCPHAMKYFLNKYDVSKEQKFNIAVNVQ